MFVKSTLAAIAYQTRDILEVMRSDTHKGSTSLRVDGGAAANDFLMQFQADVLGIPVVRPAVLQTTALGAAGLAGLGVGFWKDREAFDRLRRTGKVFVPKARSAERERAYLKWKQAVQRSRDWA